MRSSLQYMVCIIILYLISLPVSFCTLADNFMYFISFNSSLLIVYDFVLIICLCLCPSDHTNVFIQFMLVARFSQKCLNLFHVNCTVRHLKRGRSNITVICATPDTNHLLLFQERNSAKHIMM